MSYKPHTPDVPSGILYYGNPEVASDPMLKAQSTFTFDENVGKLLVNQIKTDSDITVGGNLIVEGTTTTVNSNVVEIGDSIITLNSDFPSDQAAIEDAGLEINRGTDTNVFLRWDEGTNEWTFTNDGSNYHDIAVNPIMEITAGAGLSKNLTNGETRTPSLSVNVDGITLQITSDTLSVKLIDTDQIADGAVTEAKRERTVGTFSNGANLDSDINLITTGSLLLTMTLPSSPVDGQIVTVKKVDAGAGQVIVAGAGSDLIDGAANKRLYYQYESVTCVAQTGTPNEWYII